LYAGVPFKALQFIVLQYYLFLYQTALKLLTKHEFILFFCAGANPNALWANWDGFVTSLASLWTEG